MPAFESQTGMQAVGRRAAQQTLGDEEGVALSEFAHEDVTVDLLLSRSDAEARAERERRVTGGPLTGAERGIYEWVARGDGRRDLDNLLATSTVPAADQEMVQDLVDRGYLARFDDGTYAAVDVPRVQRLVAVEFVLTPDVGVWQATTDWLADARFADERWLVRDADVAAAIPRGEREWVRDIAREAGIGLATLTSDGELSRDLEATEQTVDEAAAREIVANVVRR